MKHQKLRRTEEFKKDAVRLLENRGAQTIPEIAAKLGVSSSMLYRWRETYGGQTKGQSAAAQDEREDVEKMRRRLRELEQENTFLKKAAALFAREVK